MNLNYMLLDNPHSKIVKPPYISSDDVERPARTFLGAIDDVLSRKDTPLYKYFAHAARAGYAKESQGKALLLPAKPEGSYLVHRGILDERTKASLKEYGVLGNPSESVATYLSTGNWGGECYSEMAEKDSIVIVTLKMQELLQRRNMFIDPESIDENMFSRWSNELGKIFFVLGGIPHEAIDEIRKCY